MVLSNNSKILIQIQNQELKPMGRFWLQFTKNIMERKLTIPTLFINIKQFMNIIRGTLSFLKCIHINKHHFKDIHFKTSHFYLLVS